MSLFLNVDKTSEDQIRSLVNYVDNTKDFDIWSQTINNILDLLDNVTNDKVGEFIEYIIMFSVSKKFKDEETDVLNIINTAFIQYINHLSLDQLAMIFAGYPLLIKTLIDYRPELVNRLFEQEKHSIKHLINSELYKYSEYYSWIVKYLPILITVYESDVESEQIKYQNCMIHIREKNKKIDNRNIHTQDLIELRELNVEMLWYIDDISRIKKLIKSYYYILAQVKINKPIKSDLDKELIIRYLIKADDYIDAQGLREKLFRQYYLKSNMEAMSLPINVDEETIIQLGNHIKNLK